MPKRGIATNIKIGKRDRQILECLLTCVPVLSFNQIADQYMNSDVANTRRVLRRLVELKLIDQISCASRASPIIEEPVVDWKPGDSTPDPYGIANSLQSRWKRLRILRRAFYRIGARMRQISGLPNQSIRPLQVSHDHGLAEVYFQYRSRLLKPTQKWIGDIAYRNCRPTEVSKLISVGSQKPDALVVEHEGPVVKAIEFGGVYNAKRLSKFHQWCQRHGVAYEIW